MGLFRKRHTENDDTAGTSTDDAGAQDEVIDVRDGVTGLASSGIEPGVPGRCPECDGFGYIDHIDMANHFQVQHCRTCGHRWEYSFDEDGTVIDLTEEASPSTTDPESSGVEPSGVDGSVDRGPDPLG